MSPTIAKIVDEKIDKAVGLLEKKDIDLCITFAWEKAWRRE